MRQQRILVAGHKGLVGSAIARQLAQRGDEVMTVDRSEVDLSDKTAIEGWMQHAKPDAIVLAAAKVGGIYANHAFPAVFIYENLAVQNNVIHSAHAANVNRLVFLGSSCVYPKFAPQPIKEEALLSGPLEPTNEWYAIAKIAGIKMCQAYRKQYGRRYITVMPCNLYGPNDNFDPMTSHVLPALIRRLHDAKVEGRREVFVWGTGAPLREFLQVDDLARAVAVCLERGWGLRRRRCARSPTARRENLWIRAGCARSAGDQRFRCGTAWSRHTAGFWKMWPAQIQREPRM